jgi:glycosyltransferase involved in cell wall biosynthesis
VTARKRVLALADYYTPGYKAGGPIRTLTALVHYLGARLEIRVMTRDRDLGDAEPYPGVTPGRWVAVGGAECCYLPPDQLDLRSLRRIIVDTDHAVLYVNSLFSEPLSIKPLLLRRLGLLPRVPTVVAVRGELHPGALRLRRVKKICFLACARAVRLHAGVTWQATSDQEARYIRRWFGRRARIAVAPNLRVRSTGGAAPRRGSRTKADPLRVAFISRISRNKNLEGTLEVLRGVRTAVDFNIYGPHEDSRYWARCASLIGKLPDNVTARYCGIAPHAEIDAILRSHDLFFLPSHGENFGHVILEALDAGCPVLISDRTPWRDLEEAGVGWDLPPDDIESFRRVIEDCCTEDPRIRDARSARASDWAARVSMAPDAIERTAELFGA